MSRQHWTIGTDTTCDLRLSDPRLNRLHCRLYVAAGRWWLEPLEGEVRRAGRALSERTEIRPADRIELVHTRSEQGIALPWPATDGATGVWNVGRSPTCDLRLDAPNVSAVHARLIRGPHATWVLEDLGSTNGIFVDARRRERTHWIQVVPDSVVYFGMTPVKVSELLDQIVANFPEPPPQDGRPDRMDHQPDRDAAPQRRRAIPPIPEFEITTNGRKGDPPGAKATGNLGRDRRGRVARERRRSSQRLPVAFLGSLVTIPLLIFIFMAFRPNPTPDNPPGPAVSQAMTELLRASPDAINEEANVPEISGSPGEVSAGLSDGPLAISSPDIKPEVGQAFFWILVQLPSVGTDLNDDRGQARRTFRLGTAVAVSPRRLLTAGSLLLAAEELQRQFDGVLLLLHLNSQQPITVRRYGIHEQLARRMALADAAKKRFDELDDGSSGAEYGQQLRERADLVDVALQAVSAVDLGWIEVESDTPAFIEPDAEAVRRPRQRVDLWHAAFDSEDPFWDDSGAPQITRMSTRLESLAPPLEGVDGPSRLRFPAEGRGLNFFGSPILSADKLVGIISFSTDVQTESDRKADSVPHVLAEAVAPSVLTVLSPARK